MMPGISLSTCWCSHRHADGYEMLREMANLEFEYVELSHGIRLSLVPGILKAVQEGWIKVASVHNFCPLPARVMHAAPNLYQPTSSDPAEIRQWLLYTRRTIDFAGEVGAQYVVLHSGSVSFLWFDPRQAILNTSRGRSPQELREDERYLQILEKALARVKKKSAKAMRNLQALLRQIIPYARARGIRLGIENREGFLEMPLDHEMVNFLNETGDRETVGYWHDSGHARLKEMLGVINHEQHLLENSRRLLGMHLHDVSEDGLDHQPIGSGCIDFEMVTRFCEPGHIVVLELSPRLDKDEVILSRDRLASLLNR